MKLNKKGLTLVELLGVIVILGIIAAIAFPTVGNIMENQRKEGFAQNVNSFVEAALLDAQEDNLQTGNTVFYYTINEGTYTRKSGDSTLDYSTATNDTWTTFTFTKPLGLKSGVIEIDLTDTTTSNILIHTVIRGENYEIKQTKDYVFDQEDVDKVTT